MANVGLSSKLCPFLFRFSIMERITHLGDTIRPVGDVERSIGLLEMDWQRFRIGRRLRSLRI
jgi:hypothetical protein